MAKKKCSSEKNSRNIKNKNETLDLTVTKTKTKTQTKSSTVIKLTDEMTKTHHKPNEKTFAGENLSTSQPLLLKRARPLLNRAQ